MTDTTYIDTFEKSQFKNTVRAGIILFFITFVIFGGWSIFARLDGGAYAGGKVIVQNKTRTIQHLEGGVINEIPVTDGSRVKKGDTVMVLSDVKARSESERLTIQLHRLKATEARLLAERSLFKSPFVIPQGTPDSIAIIQRKLYDDNKANYNGRIDLLVQKKSLIQREYEGLLQKQSLLANQVNLESSLRDKKEALVNNGYAAANQLSEQEVKLSELKKENSDTNTNISTARRRLTETDLEIANIKNEFMVRASDELKDIEAQKSDISEQLAATSDILNRTNIVAPIDGTITDIQYNTIGGVVAPGSDIMSIVPENAKMLVEAHVKPQDINSVMLHQDAKVRFTAYKSVHVPSIPGKVVYVSPDTTQDKYTGQYYYTVHVVPDMETLKHLNHDVNLTAGMPADVTIITGERTPMDYFISPIRDSLAKSFTEE